MIGQPVEPLFYIVDDAKKIKLGPTMIMILKPRTNMAGRIRMLELGGQPARNARVECIVCKASLDEETIAQENRFRGGLGFEKAG
jgi:hypothetical protein